MARARPVVLGSSRGGCVGACVWVCGGLVVLGEGLLLLARLEQARLLLPLWVQQRTFDSTLSGVSKIAFVIENVIDSVHQQIVGN